MSFPANLSLGQGMCLNFHSFISVLPSPFQERRKDIVGDEVTRRFGTNATQSLLTSPTNFCLAQGRRPAGLPLTLSGH